MHTPSLPQQGFVVFWAAGLQRQRVQKYPHGGFRVCGCALRASAIQPLLVNRLPIGSLVVPFWDYLIGF